MLDQIGNKYPITHICTYSKDDEDEECTGCMACLKSHQPLRYNYRPGFDFYCSSNKCVWQEWFPKFADIPEECPMCGSQLAFDLIG